MKKLLVAIFEMLFCPAVLVVCVGVTWVARRNGIGWVQTLFFSSLAPVALITVFEWIHPARAEYNYPFRTDRRAALGELGKDLFYMLVVTRIHSLVLPTILPRLAPFAKVVGKQLGTYGAISAIHPALRIAIVLLVGELFWYWGHRLQHHVPLLWRFHRTHHVPDKLSALKASRNHPLDMLLLSVLGYLPLVMLGAKGSDLMWAALIQSIVNITSHANVKVRSGIWGWVFSTPDHHSVHHSIDIEESRSNYGCRILVWDRLWGTFRRASAAVVVGVAPRAPSTLRDELLEPLNPFRRMEPGPAPRPGPSTQSTQPTVISSTLFG